MQNKLSELFARLFLTNIIHKILPGGRSSLNIFRIYDLTSRSFRRYLSHVQREHLSNSRKMLHIIEFAKEALEKVEIAGGREGGESGDKNWDRQ